MVAVSKTKARVTINLVDTALYSLQSIKDNILTIENKRKKELMAKPVLAKKQ